MSFSESRPALNLQDIELLLQIVSRAQLMLPILSEAVQRFADGLDSPTYYWDPMRHWASVQQLIDASIRLVGLRDLERVGDFSATMDLWEALDELGAVLHTIIGLQKPKPRSCSWSVNMIGWKNNCQHACGAYSRAPAVVLEHLSGGPRPIACDRSGISHYY